MNFRGYGHGSDHVGETIRVAVVTKPKPPPDQGSAQTADSKHGCPGSGPSSGSGGADGGRDTESRTGAYSGSVGGSAQMVAIERGCPGSGSSSGSAGADGE